MPGSKLPSSKLQGLTQSVVQIFKAPITTRLKRAFHGGVKPPEHKEESIRLPIGDIIPADEFYIPITKAGAQMGNKVAVGDRVLAGQFINEPITAGEKHRMAPVSGVITGTTNILISGRVPYYSECLVLRSDNKHERVTPPENKSYQDCTRQELIERLKRAAIYGMGGGGFPALRKMGAQKIKYLIVNAVECEPYITVDHALLDSYSDEVVAAIPIAHKILGCNPQTIIALENNMSSAIKAISEAISEAIKNKGTGEAETEAEGTEKTRLASPIAPNAKISNTELPNIKLKVLPTIYPMGSEKQLILALLGTEIPSGKIAVQQGILCLNVATLRAIYRAVVHNEPLLQRIITVAGNGVPQPRNHWVRLGTSINQILLQTGVKDLSSVNVFMGGAMMNYKIDDLNMPVSSSTNCLLVFKKSPNMLANNNVNGGSNGGSNGEDNVGDNGYENGHGHEDEQRHKQDAPLTQSALWRSADTPLFDKQWTQHRECIKCGLCEQVCPARLLPQQLYRYIKADKIPLAVDEGLFACIECAACDYVCPSNIPLSDYYIFAKESSKTEQLNKYKADRARNRFNDHKLRLDKQKEELAARRAERIAKMKKTNDNSPAEDISVKQRKIASLKIQISKTLQAIDKWQATGEDSRAATLQNTRDKLQQELNNLTSK